MFDRHTTRALSATLFALAVLVAGAGCIETPQQDQIDRVEVFDGDSFEARDADGRRVEVRLFGIDAPERRQPWSRKSREALRSMVRGQVLDMRVVEIDRYDRLVAEVFLPDGRSLNAEQVAAGHAWVYRRYTDDPELLRLEREARDARRGLWSLSERERVPPWEWRRQRRASGGR
jgi:endonuclease YncB( thermonuclease family)